MINSSQIGKIARIELARPPVNALNPALLSALRQAIDTALADPSIEGVCLTGRAGMFSAGLDVPELLTLSRDMLRNAWRDFFAVMESLSRSNKPCVAAITGHSPAGGAVIALFCDYRVMAAGAYKIGLNEVQVGLAVPPAIVRAMQRLVGAHRGERLMVAGTMLDANGALSAGLVDELAAPELVETRAMAWLDEHLRLPPNAMRATRTNARADLAAVFDGDSAAELERLLDGWFGEETQRVMHVLVAKLKAKA
jgi:Delta3-Delta2-enoyl-CoA isomerase